MSTYRKCGGPLKVVFPADVFTSVGDLTTEWSIFGLLPQHVIFTDAKSVKCRDQDLRLEMVIDETEVTLLANMSVSVMEQLMWRSEVTPRVKIVGVTCNCGMLSSAEIRNIFSILVTQTSTWKVLVSFDSSFSTGSGIIHLKQHIKGRYSVKRFLLLLCPLDYTSGSISVFPVKLQSSGIIWDNCDFL